MREWTDNPSSYSYLVKLTRLFRKLIQKHGPIQFQTNGLVTMNVDYEIDIDLKWPLKKTFFGLRNFSKIINIFS